MESMSGICPRSHALPFILFVLASLTNAAHARTLEIGPGKAYATLEQASQSALPGDTLQFANGVHAGGGYILGLQGTSTEWITIRGEQAGSAIIRGGSNGFQLSDPRYLRIEDLVFEAQTGNGLNIDDGGTIETPAHHLEIRNCEWRAMNATGNNDQLKMSGIDDFSVTSCRFFDGAAGGSMIDMVGCHRGVFSDNLFQNAGSNCIQNKGGTSEIVIERNRFLQGGQRAINIGGSTGLQFFRPPGVDYEASNISVYSNFFEGSVAPIAYVGAINSRVINNTIIRPERWAIRILQESVEGFQPAGNNSFINNIVVFSSTQPAINIGSNTAPETFTFSNNLWYNPDNSSWTGPNTPVSEPGRILGQDPGFADLEYHLSSTSPARGAGLSVDSPQVDLYYAQFASPRSIGAVEYQSSQAAPLIEVHAGIAVFPNPATKAIHLRASTVSDYRIVDAIILDALGREIWQGQLENDTFIDISQWSRGNYTLVAGPLYYSLVIE